MEEWAYFLVCLHMIAFICKVHITHLCKYTQGKELKDTYQNLTSEPLDCWIIFFFMYLCIFQVLISFVVVFSSFNAWYVPNFLYNQIVLKESHLIEIKCF